MAATRTLARISIGAPALFRTCSIRTQPTRFVRPFSSTLAQLNSKPTIRPVRNVRPADAGPAAGSNNQQQQQPPKSNRKIKLLILLGTLAGATTLLRMYFGNDDLPEPSIDSQFAPTIMTENTPKRAFAPSEASVIFVLGGPGAGKGTQCAKLVQDYGFVHLSAGDLLRAEQARPGSQYGQLIADYIKSGQIVPQEITIALLENAMRESIEKQHKHKFLIDGFPRKMDQAFKFEETVAESKLVLFLDASEDVMLQRLLKRGETSGRTDDNIESIKKRFKTFRDTSMPVVEHYAKLDKVATVPTAKPVDEVYADVKTALKKYKIIE